MADQWPGTGQSGARFDDPHHVYASDLDLFGRGGLFELLSAARTRMGEETLAQWLLSPSSLEQIRERHLAVAELRPQLDLDEDLAVLGEDAEVGVHPEALTRWAEAPNRMGLPGLRWLAPALATAAVGSVAIWAFWGMATPLVLVVIVEAVLTYRLRQPLADVLHGTEQTFHGLELLSGMLKRIERYSVRSPRLQALQGELLSHHMPSSRALARLETIVDLIDSREHFILRTLDAPLMYSVQVALAAERWRRAHGRAVRGWVKAIGEIEALISFATYSYEHPDDPFPEFVDGDALFDGTESGTRWCRRQLASETTFGVGARHPRAAGGWLQYVEQKHSAAFGRNQCGAGHGRRTGAGARFAAHAAVPGGQHPHQRFAAGGQLALLCRDHPPAQDFRPGGRPASADVLTG